jgi:hypothetical protein
MSTSWLRVFPQDTKCHFNVPNLPTEKSKDIDVLVFQHHHMRLRSGSNGFACGVVGCFSEILKMIVGAVGQVPGKGGQSVLEDVYKSQLMKLLLLSLRWVGNVYYFYDLT